MKFGRYIIGLLSGLTFGILFAPKKGKKLREELTRKGSESGQEALAALFNAFKDAGADAVTEMKKLSESEQLQSALSMSKEKMREYLSQLEESGYDVAARAQEKVEKLSDMAVAVTSNFKKRAVRKRKAVTNKVKKRVKKAASVVKSRARKIKKVVAKKPLRKRRTTAKKK